MSLLVRLLVLVIAAALASVPVAVAAKPDTPSETVKETGNPDKETGNPDKETGKPAEPVPAEAEGEVPVEEGKDKPEKPAKPDKPEKDHVAPGQAKKDGVDVPLHPLGGAPGLMREPNESAHPEHTVLTETVGATPNSGVVLVKVPGADEFTALDAGAPLPMGTVVDATDGLVEIGAEAPGGVEQNAVVAGGVFNVTQDATGLTDLKLQGGDFSGCGKDGKTTARAAKRGKGNVARGLWAAGKGRFRTHGRNATASVRGTRWAVVDRCNSTTVKVFEGLVDVLDRSTGKTVPVGAGERLVARRG